MTKMYALAALAAGLSLVAAGCKEGPHSLLGTPTFTYYKIAGNVGQAGATVSVGPRSAVSDASGNYEIRGWSPAPGP